MGDETTALTTHPISDALAAELEKLKTHVPAGQVGAAHADVSLQGVEFGAAWQPRPGLWLTGYAGRMWGGGWQAGAKLAYTW